jgi:hypothetical protein
MYLLHLSVSITFSYLIDRCKDVYYLGLAENCCVIAEVISS